MGGIFAIDFEVLRGPKGRGIQLCGSNLWQPDLRAKMIQGAGWAAAWRDREAPSEARLKRGGSAGFACGGGAEPH